MLWPTLRATIWRRRGRLRELHGFVCVCMFLGFLYRRSLNRGQPQSREIETILSKLHGAQIPVSPLPIGPPDPSFVQYSVLVFPRSSSLFLFRLFISATIVFGSRHKSSTRFSNEAATALALCISDGFDCPCPLILYCGGFFLWWSASVVVCGFHGQLGADRDTKAAVSYRDTDNHSAEQNVNRKKMIWERNTKDEVVAGESARSFLSVDARAWLPPPPRFSTGLSKSGGNCRRVMVVTLSQSFVFLFLPNLKEFHLLFCANGRNKRTGILCVSVCNLMITVA